MTKQIEKYLLKEAPELSEENLDNLREQGFPPSVVRRSLIEICAFKEADAERVASAIQQMKEATRVVPPLGAVKANSRKRLWLTLMSVAVAVFSILLVFLTRGGGKHGGNNVVNDTHDADVAELKADVAELKVKAGEADKRLSAIDANMTTMADVVNSLADKVMALGDKLATKADKSDLSRMATKNRLKRVEDKLDVYIAVLEEKEATPPAPPADETHQSAATDNGTITVIVHPIPVDDEQ